MKIMYENIPTVVFHELLMSYKPKYNVIDVVSGACISCPEYDHANFLLYQCTII